MRLGAESGQRLVCLVKSAEGYILSGERGEARCVRQWRNSCGYLKLVLAGKAVDPYAYLSTALEAREVTVLAENDVRMSYEELSNPYEERKREEALQALRDCARKATVKSGRTGVACMARTYSTT